MIDAKTAALPLLDNLQNYTSHSNSDECFQFIKQNTFQYDQSHRKCKRPLHTAFPRRVLSIGLHGSDKIKLAEPSIAYGKYTALSYCWGDHQPLQTTKETIKDMKNGIDWKDLPKTFQNAIQVSRRLQIRWIWIDSLCIIQNSKSD